MTTSIRLSSIFVPDQDAALDFYVGIVGMEVHTDVDLGSPWGRSSRGRASA